MSEKNRRNVRLGYWEVTPSSPHMTFDELVDVVDDALWTDMRKPKNKLFLRLYHFFDSERRPLDPREFYEFLGSWTVEDQLYYEAVGGFLPEIGEAA